MTDNKSLSHKQRSSHCGTQRMRIAHCSAVLPTLDNLIILPRDLDSHITNLINVLHSCVTPEPICSKGQERSHSKS